MNPTQEADAKSPKPGPSSALIPQPTELTERSGLPKLPGLGSHLLLLLQLRRQLALGTRGSSQRSSWSRLPGRLVGVFSYLLSASPALPLFLAGSSLMFWPAVANSTLWSRFFFDLLCFVCTCVWICWPVLAAQVDDHAELSRFKTLPIAPLRLLLASSLGALLEPLAIILYAPMLGASLALMALHPPRSFLLAALLGLAWALFALAFSRAGLLLVLSLLRKKRGAQAIGGGFLVFLLASLLLPPVDVSWLKAAAGGLGGLTPAFLLQSAVGLSRVPTGYLGEGLRMLGEGRLLGPLWELFCLLAFAALGFAFAWRFMQSTPSRGSKKASSAARGGLPFGHFRSVQAVLVWRELIDLARNPKARLLFFVPLLLAVAMRLLSMQPLVAYFVGHAAPAWILTGLTLYAVTIFSLTFMQNAFGYDGRALRQLLAAPLDPGLLMRSKLIALGLAASVVLLFDASFFALYFGGGAPRLWLFAIGGGLCLLISLLGVGAIVSVRFATRYHAGLERRDQQPRAAILTGMAATSVGSLPALGLLRLEGLAIPSWPALGVLFLLVLAYAALFRLALPHLEIYFVDHREQVLRALARD